MPLVLCYHAVSDDWDVSLAVTTQQLGDQLELLVARGYRGVTFHEAVTSSPAGRTVAITFDDGFASVLELAFPILSSLGLVATVFVVTDFVDEERPFDWFETTTGEETEVRGLTWAQLGQLAADRLGDRVTHPHAPPPDAARRRRAWSWSCADRGKRASVLSDASAARSRIRSATWTSAWSPRHGPPATKRPRRCPSAYPAAPRSSGRERASIERIRSAGSA